MAAGGANESIIQDGKAATFLDARALVWGYRPVAFPQRGMVLRVPTYLNKSDAMVGSELKIALLSEGEINSTHGTGVFLLRLFGAHRQLLTITPSSVTPPTVTAAKPCTSFISRLERKVENRMRTLARKYQSRAEIRHFQPDIIVAVIYSEFGLKIIEHVLAEAPGVPLILWMLDLFGPDRIGKHALMDSIAASTTEIWMLAPEMESKILAMSSNWPPRLTRRIRHHWPVPHPNRRKVHHRDVGPDFRVIMLGNIWDTGMIATVSDIWRRAQIACPELQPIQWICHKASYQRVGRYIEACGSEIKWFGEVSDNELPAVLASADMALVPVSFEPNSDYTKHSIPSRIGDLASVGLPIAVFAHEASATASYVARFGMADLIAQAGSDAADQLVKLIVDTPRRRALAARAVHYAGTCLVPEMYRASVFSDIHECAAAVNRSKSPVKAHRRSNWF
jgi:hypothetical protein